MICSSFASARSLSSQLVLIGTAKSRRRWLRKVIMVFVQFVLKLICPENRLMAERSRVNSEQTRT